MRADLADLKCVCDEIARAIKGAESSKIAESSAIFLLCGDIGAGKTTLVKAFAKYVGIKDSVTSPTFSLLHIYSASNSVLGMQFRTCGNFRTSTDLSLVDSPKISTNTKAIPQSLPLRFCESQNLVENISSLRDSAKQNRGNPPIKKTQKSQGGWLLRDARKFYELPRSHSLARNDENLDSSLRKCSAQNDNKVDCHADSANLLAMTQNTRIAESALDSANQNNPSLRANPQDLRGNPPCEKTQNLQNRLPRSHSLARNDENLDSSLRLHSAQNDNKVDCHADSVNLLAMTKNTKIAESTLDSANQNNPSLRANPQDLRGNPPCEKTQNLQNRWLLRNARKSFGLPRSHSLARNDENLDSSVVSLPQNDNFINSAESQNLTIYHYDLFNRNLCELLDLGLLDLLGESGIHFVEWGDERLFDIIKNAFENIFIIQITKAKNDRIYEFKSEF